MTNKTENEKGIFDTTDLEQQVKLLRKDKETKERNVLISLISQTIIQTNLIKAEVENVLNDYEENWGAVIQAIKKRLGLGK